MEKTIREYIARRGVQASVRVIAADDTFRGAERLVEVYGYGELVPNTIIMGDSEEPSHRDRYCDMLAAFHRARRNVVVLREDDEGGFGERRRIDVWWGGLQANGALMLILAYLLQTSPGWRGAEVRLKLVAPDEAAAESARENLRRMIRGLRIEGAISEVLVSGGRAFPEILRESSREADVVFLGIAEPGDNFRTYYEGLQSMAQGLPTVVFVLAAQDIVFSEVLLERQQ